MKWETFFHVTTYRGSIRYDKCLVDGKRVERCSTKNSTTYCIGNSDFAKVFFKSEDELLKAVRAEP